MSHCYDHQDYINNPEKYKLYKSARIAHPDNTELAMNLIVTIRYFASVWNNHYNDNIPVYEVWAVINGVKTTPQKLYACALADFVL